MSPGSVTDQLVITCALEGSDMALEREAGAVRMNRRAGMYTRQEEQCKKCLYGTRCGTNR